MQPFFLYFYWSFFHPRALSSPSPAIWMSASTREGER